MFKICDRFYIKIYNNTEETIKDINNSEDYITSSDLHDGYIPLANDYGPINICDIIKFNCLIHEKLNHPKLLNRNIVYYIYNNNSSTFLLNTILLAGSYLIFLKNYNPEKVIFKLYNFFNDHPCYYIDCISTWGGYFSSITDCFRTLFFIHNNKILDFNNFNITEYEYLSDFKYRDMNIIGNKFLAMACPSSKDINSVINDLKKKNIKVLIRLNGENIYDKNLFINKNIIVHDLFFEDLSVPNINIIKKFMNLIDNTDNNELVAIHCRAGLGRTGLLICIWLIIKLNFTPSNAIAYIRLIRPGSIMGYQGFFLESFEYFKKFIY